ncbi:uncharacterized protein LOC128726252 [Anopheles nili]|uniref:uncharacterized protein LOC128726252 n=1 Tax=Anopheles nili TaxID=185578 RepID=UPI00237C3298|nr:uncharacterized protein LOC128726252 [Anopheles nili]
MFLILALCGIISSFHTSKALPPGATGGKHMNIEMCLVWFDVHLNTIIRTEESRSMGARFLDDADLNSREQCLRLCCETENCDVFVFEEKSPEGTCFLFQCGPPENFRCKFTRHSNYTSAVLSIPPPRQEMEQPSAPLSSSLTTQIQLLATQPSDTTNNNKNVGASSLSQHEMELISLKVAGNGLVSNSKQIPGNFASLSATTTFLPPLGVRLGEVITSSSVNTPKQQFPSFQQCGHFEFSCHSGECIAIYNVCDGIPQCDDGSDEGTECPQKNAAQIITPVAGTRRGDPRSGLPEEITPSRNGSPVNQPLMMIPSVHADNPNENNPTRLVVAKSMPPVEQQHLYQPIDYQQSSTRYIGVPSIELQQQQKQHMMKPLIHRNREDPMTAPKTWENQLPINEPYVETLDNRIFNHKGGFHLPSVSKPQQYQETIPDSNFVASSSDIGDGTKSYLSRSGSNVNLYPQQTLQSFSLEQPPLQQPSYSSAGVLPQWLGGNTMRSSWIIQPVEENRPGSDSGNKRISLQEQYTSPVAQQGHTAVRGPQDDIHSITNLGPIIITPGQSSSILQQIPSIDQAQRLAEAKQEGKPGITTSGIDQFSGNGESIRDRIEFAENSLPGVRPGSLDSTLALAVNGGSANNEDVKHKPIPTAKLSSGRGAGEYDEAYAYEDSYPAESTNPGEMDAKESTTEIANRTESQKKKMHKHHKHERGGSRQPSSLLLAVNTTIASEHIEQKKKKKTKTIKKDKPTSQAVEHSLASDQTGKHANPIIHEHLKAQIHKDLEIEFTDHDGYSDRPGGAMLSLTLGVLLTAAMGILLSCRMRVARRRIRRPGKSSYAHDADFLVNGMYL